MKGEIGGGGGVEKLNSVFKIQVWIHYNIDHSSKCLYMHCDKRRFLGAVTKTLAGVSV